MKLLTLCGVKQHPSFWFWNPSFVLHQALIRELIKPFRQNSSLEDVVQRLQQLHLDFGSTKARSVPSVPEASPHRSVPTQLVRSHSNETASIPAHNTEAFTPSREPLTSHPVILPCRQEPSLVIKSCVQIEDKWMLFRALQNLDPRKKRLNQVKLEGFEGQSMLF